jgi:hypothetical protein
MTEHRAGSYNTAGTTTTTDSDAPQSFELRRLILHLLSDPGKLAALLSLCMVEGVQSLLRLVVQTFEIEEPLGEEIERERNRARLVREGAIQRSVEVVRVTGRAVYPQQSLYSNVLKCTVLDSTMLLRCIALNFTAPRYKQQCAESSKKDDSSPVFNDFPPPSYC